MACSADEPEVASKRLGWLGRISVVDYIYRTLMRLRKLGQIWERNGKYTGNRWDAAENAAERGTLEAAPAKARCHLLLNKRISLPGSQQIARNQVGQASRTCLQE